MKIHWNLSKPIQLVSESVIPINFNSIDEESPVSKQLLVFAMAWMGTRDIYTALGLTAVFTILSDSTSRSEILVITFNTIF